ncbi:MAG: fumarylacetoacetate hydrolase family protein [Bacteroidota bacterium]
MMQTTDTIQRLAQQLRDAKQQGIPCAPLREVIGTTDLSSAYAIQQMNTQYRIDQGARLVGRKIGLTSKAVQQQLGVDQPDYGSLLHDMEVLNGGEISVQQLMQAKVEGEIAFVLKKDLNEPRLSTAELLAAIDYVVAAIEIVGSRIENWDIKITDTIADNASASHFVIGHQPMSLAAVDVVGCQMNIFKNEQRVSQGQGADCLGSPINATLWLARTMASLGTPLKAGEVILSGALGPMVNVQAGDTFVAQFAGLGEVSVWFTE